MQRGEVKKYFGFVNRIACEKNLGTILNSYIQNSLKTNFSLRICAHGYGENPWIGEKTHTKTTLITLFFLLKIPKKYKKNG
jgi:hypothetical protein